MPELRVELFPSATRPYSAMLDACAVITALMKRPENNFQLTMGLWKFNEVPGLFIRSEYKCIQAIMSIFKLSEYNF